jgi:hypothetical protein
VEKAKGKQRFCGNCGYHNMYDYPDWVLCWMRFSEGKEPIVRTLWCCEHWSSSSQECFCVEEAKRSQRGK